MRHGLGILLIALVQTLLLAGMVGARQWTLSTGTAMVLDVMPVDPRSLFSGDYVILQYAISRVAPEALAGDDDFAPGDPIHVVMARDGNAWQPLSLHRSRPKPDAGRIAIRGRVRNAGSGFLSVEYGIESFYLPEGEGRAIEARIRDARVQAEVVVDSDGDAVLSGLLVDGAVAYRGRLF